jgi:hypothetical protein|tara:strand:+ start:282 stop:521 length:240 start_codon:yes stop_codon:yes gene_type:complete
MSAQQEYDRRILMKVLEDLKYANRLSMLDFVELFFPDSVEDYWMRKWEMFRDNPLGFYWSLDTERLGRLVSYIEKERRS